MATLSILPGGIPWTQESGWLQSMSAESDMTAETQHTRKFRNAYDSFMAYVLFLFINVDFNLTEVSCKQ